VDVIIVVVHQNPFISLEPVHAATTPRKLEGVLKTPPLSIYPQAAGVAKRSSTAPSDAAWTIE
jgi:hypothetical protein